MFSPPEGLAVPPALSGRPGKPLSPQETLNSHICVCVRIKSLLALLFCFVCAADLELGLKRDALGPVDGSSLEALLKGEPLDRRSGVSDPRGPEDDTATVEPPATSATTHTSSGRVRKVWLKAG